MAKFFVLLAAFAAIVQISLASPTFTKCGCGAKLAGLGNLVTLGSAPVCSDNLQPIERTEIVSSHISPLNGMFNPSPYYRRGCTCGARSRTVILPATSNC